MEFKVVFLVSLLSLLVEADENPTNATTVEKSAANERIVGGAFAPNGAFPHQVSMRDASNSHFCGGAILGNRWIVTAAHCLTGGCPNSIVVGSNSIVSGGTSYAVKYCVSHPGFSSNSLQNDIGLVLIGGYIKFNDFVKPIALPTADPPVGAMTLLSGWGRTSYPGNSPNDLKYIRLKTIDMNECAMSLSDVKSIWRHQICTLNSVNQGACHGDSGGPLTYNNQLVGVVSWGIPCGKGYPDVFTRVSSYIEWLKGTVAKFQTKKLA